MSESRDRFEESYIDCVDDASFGQRLAAYVVPAQPEAVDPDEVLFVVDAVAVSVYWGVGVRRG